jgi:hypothetical protein
MMKNKTRAQDRIQGRSKVVAAFGRKPLNFRITSSLEATLEQPWTEFCTFLIGQSCCSALNSRAARQRRPARRDE